MDDPGGPIRHPARAPLTLSDLFVYPDLIEVNDRIDQRLYKSSVFLTNAESLKGGVVLEGDEKSGRTSLLRRLFCEYYDRNFYPILLNGSQLYRATEQSVAQALTSAIEEQYGPGRREEFMQLSRAKRIVLIDDLDDSRVKSSAARAELIRLLKAQFDYVLISIEQPLGLTSQRPSPDDPLITFSRFRIQPFGYLLRNKLVAKWHSLGADGALDEPTLLARRDASERIIDSV